MSKEPKGSSETDIPAYARPHQNTHGPGAHAAHERMTMPAPTPTTVVEGDLNSLERSAVRDSIHAAHSLLEDLTKAIGRIGGQGTTAAIDTGKAEAVDCLSTLDENLKAMLASLDVPAAPPAV